MRNDVSLQSINFDPIVVDPVAPLPPQRFQTTMITSKSVSFSWEAPFHCGGGEVDEYELGFEQETILYNQEAGNKNQKVRRKFSSFLHNQHLHLNTSTLAPKD